MNDIFSYTINPYLEDEDFRCGLSQCSHNQHLEKIRRKMFETWCHENLNHIIKTSFPSHKRLIHSIQHDTYNRANNYSSYDEHHEYHIFFMFKLIKCILRNLGTRKRFHHYDFEKYNKISNLNSGETVRCTNSYHCICDLIYSRYTKHNFLHDYDITFMELNYTYRVPIHYMKLLRHHFPHAYALIY
jgi:hypothetical protein